MKLPKEFIDSLEGVTGFNKEAFEYVHQSGEQVTSIRLNPSKPPTANPKSGNLTSTQESQELFTHDSRFTTHDSRLPTASADRVRRSLAEEQALAQADPPFTSHASRLKIDSPVPWCKNAYYLSDRPVFTLDPLFHAGAYYVQEPSSMFLDHIMRKLFTDERTIRILDLCAAPGGKTTLFASLPFTKLVVANEVIKTRVGMLHENVVKWGAPNVFVTNNDPKDFASLPGFFDVIVIDAPCSGSGMFRKDQKAIGEWSVKAVELCGERQQRILADVLPALAENGLLIYSTCSYSKRENEDNLDWLCQNFELDSIKIDNPAEWKIVETQSDLQHAWGYRFYPDRVKGEGFFVGCLEKKSATEQSLLNSKPVNFVKKLEQNILGKWTDNSQHFEYIRISDQFVALPAEIFNDYLRIQSRLSIRKRGVMLGAINKAELAPDHELALCTIISPQLPFTELSLETALQYLRKQSLSIDFPVPGWNLAKYSGLNLGWMKVLLNRINNYYPSPWRIRMQ